MNEEIPWIPWNGGDCPLNDDEVELWQYRDKSGESKRPHGTPSKYSNWHHCNDEYDIVAYRVVKWKERKEPAPTDNDTWECLLHTNSILGKRVHALEAELMNLRAKVEELSWIPFAVRMPTEADGNKEGKILTTDGENYVWGHNQWDQKPLSIETHWRRYSLP